MRYTVSCRVSRASYVAACLSFLCSLAAPALSKTIYCPGYPVKCHEVDSCPANTPTCDGVTPCCFFNVQAAYYPSVIEFSGFQVVPPNGSTATGNGVVVVDIDANTLTFDLTHNVTGETAAHIHGYAGRGANAGVLFTLPTGPDKVGTWNYPENAESNILSGLTYMNIHSATFPGGEIRAQVEPPYVNPADVPTNVNTPEPRLFEFQPNPSTGATTVQYTLATRSRVNLSLYNAGGQRVRVLDSGIREPGNYYVDWDGSNDRGEIALPGVYFARLETETGVKGCSLVLLSR